MWPRLSRDPNPPEYPQAPMKECPCCEGTGRIKVSWEDECDPGVWIEDFDRCEMCDGRGEVEDTDAHRDIRDFFEN